MMEQLWQVDTGVVTLLLWCGCVYALYLGLSALFNPRRSAAAGPSFGPPFEPASQLQVPLTEVCVQDVPVLDPRMRPAPKFTHIPAQAAAPVMARPLYPPVSAGWSAPSTPLGAAHGSRHLRPLYADVDAAADTATEEAAPAKAAVSTLTRGQEVEGKVVGVADFGVFIDVGVDTDGLLHINKMSPELVVTDDAGKRSINPSVTMGTMITATVATADKKLSLTQKELGDDGNDKKALDSFSAGDKAEGTVNGIVEFGFFVDVGARVNGLVHVSEAMPESLGDSDTALKVGDSVTVRVLNVDTEKSKLTLSQYLEGKPKSDNRKSKSKKSDDSEEQQQVMDMMRDLEGTDNFIDGKVVSTVEYGAFVEVGGGVTGLLHISALQTTRTENVTDVINVGDEIRVRVEEVEKGGKISLSMLTMEESGDYDDDEEYEEEEEKVVKTKAEDDSDDEFEDAPAEPYDPDFDDYFDDVQEEDPGLDELMNEREDEKGERVDDFWASKGVESGWKGVVGQYGGHTIDPSGFGVLETSDMPPPILMDEPAPILVEESPVAVPAAAAAAAAVLDQDKATVE